MAPPKGSHFQAYSLYKIKFEGCSLSYSFVAEKLGCSPATISEFFNKGYVPPSIPDFLADLEKLMINNGVITPEDVAAAAGNKRKYWEESEKMRADHRIERQALMPDVLGHWKLEGDPFYEKFQPFISKEFERTVAKVLHCAQRNIFTAVIGQVGWGKTTMIQNIKDRIADEMPHVLLSEVVVNDASEILAKHVRDAIMEAIGGELQGSRQKRGSQFEKNLISLRDQGKIITVFIDDAQWLAPKMFGQLKLFSEMEEGYRRLVGIIMFGQEPELDHRLDAIRAAGWRVNRIRLHGLRGETKDYVKQRIRVAGGRPDDIMTTGALDHLCEIMRKRKLDYPLPLSALMSLMLSKGYELGLPKIEKAMVDDFFTPTEMGVAETKKQRDMKRISSELRGSTGFNANQSLKGKERASGAA